jgi:hypothetical protein
MSTTTPLRASAWPRQEWPSPRGATGNSAVDQGFFYWYLKISVVTDKREYRIYRKIIGDRNKISKEI